MSTHMHRNLNKCYTRFYCLCKVLEAIYIHVCMNIPILSFCNLSVCGELGYCWLQDFQSTP